MRESVLPRLVPIPGLTVADLEREMNQVGRESRERQEAERRRLRAERAADPHRCHCPNCTWID